MCYIAPLHWKSITIYIDIHLGSGLRSTVTSPITSSSNWILEHHLFSGRFSAAPLVLLQPTMHWSHSTPCSRGVTSYTNHTRHTLLALYDITRKVPVEPEWACTVCHSFVGTTYTSHARILYIDDRGRSLCLMEDTYTPLRKEARFLVISHLALRRKKRKCSNLGDQWSDMYGFLGTMITNRRVVQQR